MEESIIFQKIIHRISSWTGVFVLPAFVWLWSIFRQLRLFLQEYRENTIDTMWLDGLIASKAITPSLGVNEVSWFFEKALEICVCSKHLETLDQVVNCLFFLPCRFFLGWFASTNKLSENDHQSSPKASSVGAGSDNSSTGGVLRCGLQGLWHGQEPYQWCHPVHAEGATGAARQERPLVAY